LKYSEYSCALAQSQLSDGLVTERQNSKTQSL
jgi:hypothetical protein